MPKMQETIRQLREEWKAADQGGPSNQQLWLRFDRACNAAYAFVEQWVQHNRVEVAAHKAQRQALIAELQAWTAEHAADTDWNAFAEALLAKLRDSFRADRAEIGHVKLSLTCGDRVVLGNVGSIGAPVNMRGDSGVKGASAVMTLNARVQMPPEALQKAVEATLPETAASFGVAAAIRNLKCLMPGRPNPTYRYQTVV